MDVSNFNFPFIAIWPGQQNFIGELFIFCMLYQVYFTDRLLFLEWTLEKQSPADQSLKLDELFYPWSLNDLFWAVYIQQIACDKRSQRNAWIYSKLWQAFSVVKNAELAAFVELNFRNLNSFIVCKVGLYV